MKRLFSTSGIRGIYPSDISPVTGFKLGCLLPSVFGSECVTAIDGRTSSPVLEHALLSGLLSCGCNVKRLGLAPLPTLAYSVKATGSKFGVMITASHNPPNYNGFKIYREGGWELMPDEEELIEKKLLMNEYSMGSWCDVGLCIDYSELLSRYIDDVVAFTMDGEAKSTLSFKVIVDCCNGPASLVTPKVLSLLGAEVVALNANIDGFFPGREPEPRPDVLVELSSYVRNIGAKVGLAHDGDADRVAVIDADGSFVYNDRIIAYMAKRAISRGEGRTIVTTIDTSMCVDEVVEKLGGEVIRTKLGKTHVELYKRSNVAIAAEPWKIINPRWGPWADGILTAAILIHDISKSKSTINDLLSDIPAYPQIRESYPCPEEKKSKVMMIIEEELEGVVGDVREAWRYDGVRVNRNSGAWILIRASGTEPKIRLYVEARDHVELKELAERGRRLILKALKA